MTEDNPFFSGTVLRMFRLECITGKMDFDFFVLSDEVDPATQKPKMELGWVKGGVPVCCKCRYSNID